MHIYYILDNISCDHLISFSKNVPYKELLYNIFYYNNNNPRLIKLELINMRLKEPLYGIRVASMHFIAHLSLLLNMIRIDTDLWTNQNYAKFVKDYEATEHFDHDADEIKIYEKCFPKFAFDGNEKYHLELVNQAKRFFGSK